MFRRAVGRLGNPRGRRVRGSSGYLGVWDPTGGESRKGSGLPVEWGAEEIRLLGLSPGREVRELERDDLQEALTDSDIAVWIDLLRPQAGARDLLTGELGLGPLVIEDCLGPLRMPKMDAFDRGVFFAAFALRLDRDDPSPAHLRAVEVDLVVGENYLVTVRDGPVREIEDALEHGLESYLEGRWGERGDRDPPGERLAYAALDSLVDGHLPALVRAATAAEELEERLDPLNERLSTEALENLILLRRNLSAFRRLAISQQESLRRLGRWTRGLREHLSDVADNQREAVDMAEANRDYVEGAVESYRMRRDERSEVGIRRLTVLAGIIGPLTLLAGWWGANFENIPGAASQWGFAIFIGVQLLFAAAAVWFMRGRGLL